jgi:hypothetical protein
MPIQGLTDRAAAFPQIGILRKGGPKPNEKQPGPDLHHFRFTSEHPDVMAAFGGIYGNEPTDINILLPYRTTDENLSAWREHWIAGGLVHRCDGKTTIVSRKQDGNYTSDPKPCPGQCKPVGRLSVIVPELKRLAFVTVLTTSLHDIMTLTENLTALEMIRGDLRGIPLILRRRPRKVSTPAPDGKRVRREKWLLTVEAAPQWVALQLATQQTLALPRLPGGELPELEAPDDENGITIDGHTGEILNTGLDMTYPEDDESETQAPPPPTSPAPKGAEAVPSATQTTTAERPFSAVLVRAYIRKRSGVWQRGPAGDWSDAKRDDLKVHPPSENQVGAVVALMHQAVIRDGDSQADADRKRHELLRFCLGLSGTRQISREEASAIIGLWKQEGENCIVNEYAAREAAAVLTAYAPQQGQLALQLEAPAASDAELATFFEQEN